MINSSSFSSSKKQKLFDCVEVNDEKKNGKVIVFYNIRKDIGKTTNCYDVSIELSSKYKDKKILMIDLDPQMNLSKLIIKDLIKIEDNWENIIMDTKNIMDFIPNSINQPEPSFIKYKDDNLYLLFGSEDISNLEESMTISTVLLPTFTDNYFFTITRLNRFINKIKPKFDFILIDLSSSYNTLSRNIIGLSDGWFIPCVIDEFSFFNINKLLKLIKKYDDEDYDNDNYTNNNKDSNFIYNDNINNKKLIKNVIIGGKSAEYLIPDPKIKILGFIINKDSTFCENSKDSTKIKIHIDGEQECKINSQKKFKDKFIESIKKFKHIKEFIYNGNDDDDDSYIYEFPKYEYQYILADEYKEVLNTNIKNILDKIYNM